ncbi:MAG TPA: cellulose binding domain-containing protein [Polyangia bacterium]|nr:cellulose binding domain-containing protein [Polyangia bacterium]
MPLVTTSPRRLALAACLLAGAACGACQGADQYYRHRSQDGGPGLAAGYAGGGAAGAGDATGAAGLAGDGGPMDGGDAGAPKVKVLYTCRSNDTGQASFVLDVTNEGSFSFALSDLSLRYWYTIDAGKEQELDCDVASLGCTNIVTSADTPGPKFVAVMPPKPKANEYVEIAFKPGAFALDPLLETGQIQLRLHNKDFSPIVQTDDFSYDCSAMGAAIESTKITAYIDGILIWGSEPPPGTGPPI